MTKKKKKVAEEAKAEKAQEQKVAVDAQARREDAQPEQSDARTDAELEAARKEIAELKDKLLRAYAEMDNVRKRARREVEDAHKFGVEKFALAVLEVMDNLERALQVDEGNEQGLREGVRLTLDSWHKMMRQFHLERIDGLGQQFDPHVHEALSQMPSEEPRGTIIAQHVAGYKLHGRLIRPAKVLVSSGPTEEVKEPDEGEA
ncbi:MAG: nucleotide exchange factor GrpE [Zetaproteobacteria bacterium]|nr:MAG: nucleotide exchange factor GrpE [Zetaproteobacteria bacterium]